MKYKTEQESFWAGEFGNEYVQRNQGEDIVRSNLHMFIDVIERTSGINSVIEFGSNIGLNLKALKKLLPEAEFSAVEINMDAVEQLKNNVPDVKVYHQSILETNLEKTYDFVLIKGVLIHINPNELPSVYEKLYNASSKYICVCEYYNPTPVAVEYRGNKDRLFKRDFAGEIMDKYPDSELLDYRFVYHRDNNFPMGDCTWFLLKKNSEGGK